MYDDSNALTTHVAVSLIYSYSDPNQVANTYFRKLLMEFRKVSRLTFNEMPLFQWMKQFEIKKGKKQGLHQKTSPTSEGHYSFALVRGSIKK